MNNPLKYLFFIVIFIYSCQSSGQNDTKQLISAGSLKEDFKIFQKTIEEAHPGLYWYIDKKEMDAFFDSLSHELDGPMEDEEFFKLLLPAVGKIRCVHTQIHLSENTQRRLFSNVKILPISIAVIQGKVFVTESSDNLPPAGIELININGDPVDEILKKMMEIIPSDGINTSHKYHSLKTGFREAYGLLYGQSDTFNITGRDSSQRLIQYILKAKSPDQLQPPVMDTIPIKYDYINDNKIAVLSIQTFQLSSGSFNDRINGFFSVIEKNKIEKLIIDIRNNQGGNNTNVTTLFSYLCLRPFQHLKKTELKTRTLTYSNNITNVNLFNNLRATKTLDGTYEVDYIYPGRNVRQAVSQHAFSGDLIVLANGGTVSAASEFVALVRGYDRGLVIGEEAGGCYYGATGGNYLNLVLPHSGIRVTIPTVKILTGVPEDFIKQPKGRGVIPEIMITPTVSDLINHTDPELKSAVNIFTTNRSAIRH